MIIKKISEVPAVDVQMEGVKDAKVKVLFGPKDGVPTFAMRIFELGPGGNTPFHDHGFEHEVLIMEGKLAVVSESGDTPVEPGQVIYMPADEKHQFKNLSDTDKASFMCLVPIAYQK